MKVKLSHPSKKVRASAHIRGSKSENNRALILKALYFPELELKNESNSRDTQLLKAALASKEEIVDIKDAGTAMRFSTAFFAVQEGRVTRLQGTERMHQRPIGILVDALRALGADIQYADKEGYPPLLIHGKKLEGGELELDASVSSQFISALMMIAPSLEKGLQLRWNGLSVSAPYIYMTANIMERMGFEVKIASSGLEVKPGVGKPPKYFTVESDWSSASYWYLMAALAEDAEIFMKGYREVSFQGDAAVRGYFQSLGVANHFIGAGYRLSKSGETLKLVKLNLIEQPDLAQTLAVACAALHQKVLFTGLQTLRIKETDRLLALKTELEKTGAKITIGDDFLEVTEGITSVEGVSFDTYHDHRMAMAFAPLALLGEITINDPDVVNKSYPNYWEDLKGAGFEVEDEG